MRDACTGSVEHPFEGAGEAGHIGRVNQDAGAARDFRERADIRGHDRDAERHRLQHREAEALVERRQHDHAGSGVQFSSPLVGHVALDQNTALERWGLSLGHPRFRRLGQLSRQDEARRRGLPFDESPVRRQQDGNILARLERADKQDMSRHGGRPLGQGPGDPGRHAGPAHGNPSGATRSRASICCFEYSRDRDHKVGSGRVRVHQFREVAPHLSARAVRMRQEIEVVHRAHPAPRTGRQQQRGRRVHDVEASRRQGLDGRPAHAVPGPGQRPDRHPAVDEGGAAELPQHRGRRPVAPGGTPEGQLEAGGRRVAGGLEVQEVERELVHPFADTGAVAEGRPVIEEEMHHGVLYPTAKGPGLSCGGRPGASVRLQLVERQGLDSLWAV